MQISEKNMIKLSELIADAVVNVLEQRGVIKAGVMTVANESKPEKSAYQKTEALLYNYRGFCRIVRDKQLEIEEIKKYGVPQRCGAMGERVQSSPVLNGIVLPDDTVEQAVQKIEDSMRDTVAAISLIDKCMETLKGDQYYKILEMRYFEGRTQEDIALEFGVSQVTISNNKSRLVKELSIRLFPNQTVTEMLS